MAAIRYGFGRHLEVLGLEGLFHWFKVLYSFEFLYTLAMLSVKFSMYAALTLPHHHQIPTCPSNNVSDPDRYCSILFQYRIFPIVQFRRILLWLHHFVLCLTISCVLVSIFQCVPIHDFWDTLAGTLSPGLGGRCINVQNYFLIAGAINAATDFTLLALVSERYAGCNACK